MNNRLQRKTRTGDEPSITVFTYDRNGNQLTQNTNGDMQTHTYNAFNHLVRVERDGMEALYTYRADGLRHAKTVNGFTTTHLWDRGSIVLELNPSGAVINRFARGLGHLIHSDQHGFYLFNVRGDVVQRVDGNGEVIHTYRYDAFGNQLNGDDINTNPFRFAGEYLDWETGFIYLRARFYNPVLGRFISEDPYWTIHNMQFGTNPAARNGRLTPDPLAIMQASNLFVYCLNNPVRFIDPTGLHVWLVHGTWNDDSMFGSKNAWSIAFRAFMTISVFVGEGTTAHDWSSRNLVYHNTDLARQRGARSLVSNILEHRRDNPNDPIRLVGYSHGGNVAILAANILADFGIHVDTLITIATPVREYQLSERAAATVGQFINVYNTGDLVQTAGGRPTFTTQGGLGIIPGGRTFDGAQNLRVPPRYEGQTIGNHGFMHSNPEIWRDYILNSIIR